MDMLLGQTEDEEEERQSRVRKEKHVNRKKATRVELKVGTLNVGTMTGKSRELADVMERRKVDALCVQETRWKGEKASPDV